MTVINQPLSCVTWNVHRCRGNDKVVDTDRTSRVLLKDVVQPGSEALVLTEADACDPAYSGLLDIAQIEDATGLRSVHTLPARRWSDASSGFLGIVVFLDPAIEVEGVTVLDLPGHTHRGAVVVEALRDGRKFRIIGAHLSLSQMLRWAQMRVIAQHMQRGPSVPTVLIGDLNEWRPWGGLIFAQRRFGAAFQGPAKPTFPVNSPILPLDRVLTTGGAQVISTQVLDSAGIRATSDHRPLAAKVDLHTLP